MLPPFQEVNCGERLADSVKVFYGVVPQNKILLELSQLFSNRTDSLLGTGYLFLYNFFEFVVPHVQQKLDARFVLQPDEPASCLQAVESLNRVYYS